MWLCKAKGIGKLLVGQALQIRKYKHPPVAELMPL